MASLEDYLNKPLTNDKTAKDLEDNMRGLLAVGFPPDPMHLEYVKLNKLERFAAELFKKNPEDFGDISEIVDKANIEEINMNENESKANKEPIDTT